MVAVIYDPETGIISMTIQGTEANIALHGSYIPVTDWKPDYDSKYHVRDGKLVENE
jgi:hypothetical protein